MRYHKINVATENLGGVKYVVLERKKDTKETTSKLREMKIRLAFYLFFYFLNIIF